MHFAQPTSYINQLPVAYYYQSTKQYSNRAVPHQYRINAQQFQAQSNALTSSIQESFKQIQNIRMNLPSSLSQNLNSLIGNSIKSSQYEIHKINQLPGEESSTQIVQGEFEIHQIQPKNNQIAKSYESDTITKSQQIPVNNSPQLLQFPRFNRNQSQRSKRFSPYDQLNLQIQQDLIFCVICNQTFSPHEEFAHLQKHKKKYQKNIPSQKIQPKTSIKQSQLNLEPVQKPIIIPQTNNIIDSFSFRAQDKTLAQQSKERLAQKIDNPVQCQSPQQKNIQILGQTPIKQQKPQNVFTPAKTKQVIESNDYGIQVKFQDSQYSQDLNRKSRQVSSIHSKSKKSRCESDSFVVLERQEYVLDKNFFNVLNFASKPTIERQQSIKSMKFSQKDQTSKKAQDHKKVYYEIGNNQTKQKNQSASHLILKSPKKDSIKIDSQQGQNFKSQIFIEPSEYEFSVHNKPPKNKQLNSLTSICKSPELAQDKFNQHPRVHPSLAKIQRPSPEQQSIASITLADVETDQKDQVQSRVSISITRQSFLSEKKSPNIKKRDIVFEAQKQKCMTNQPIIYTFKKVPDSDQKIQHPPSVPESMPDLQVNIKSSHQSKNGTISRQKNYALSEMPEKRIFKKDKRVLETMVQNDSNMKNENQSIRQSGSSRKQKTATNIFAQSNEKIEINNI